jgi:hypothetical protein
MDLGTVLDNVLEDKYQGDKDKFHRVRKELNFKSISIFNDLLCQLL